MKFAVIKTGGKQYLVRKDDEIVVDFLKNDVDATVELETLALGDFDSGEVEVGTPVLKTQTKVKILENLKGDKLRVARFRSKTRGRTVTGFRPMLSRIKVIGL